MWSYMYIISLQNFYKPYILLQGILNRAIKYQIVNEQLSIYNPTSQQFKSTFKYFKSECQEDNDAVTVSDKEALIIIFQEVTKLKSLWCIR